MAGLDARHAAHGCRAPDGRADALQDRQQARGLPPERDRRHRRAVYTEVLGLGQEVAGVVPPVVWQAIRAVATKTGRPPTILLVSEEPYIPWELAVVEPALVPSLATAPPFLAAQARIGRWLQAVTLSDGRARPSPKPPMAKQVRTRVVIWGDYSKTEWPDLTEARDEANALIKDYGMVTVDPTNQAMFDLLRDRAGPDLMHFAVHGHWSEDGTDVNGIVLTDARPGAGRLPQRLPGRSGPGGPGTVLGDRRRVRPGRRVRRDRPLVVHQ